MFDSIYWEKKLPLPTPVNKLKINWKEQEFQTKDLECLMNRYKVNKLGQLFKLHEEREWVSDKTDKLLGGHLKTISSQWVKSDHTGTIIFYNTICSDPQQKQGWLYDKYTQEEINGCDAYDYSLDFKAIFIKGKLYSVNLISIEAIPVKEYLIRHNEWLDSVNEKHSKLSYKIKSRLRKIPAWTKFIRFLSFLVRKQQTFIGKIY